MNLFKYRINNHIDKEFINCGHRGCPWLFPENTIPSLREAVRSGANALEVDLCITSDGVVILYHDWDPETVEARLRYNGLEPDTGYTPYLVDIRSKYNFSPINEITHAEVIDNYYYRKKGVGGYLIKGDQIPTLGSFLDFVKQNVSKLNYIFLDIKCPADQRESGHKLVRQVQDHIRDINLTFVLESFDPKFLNQCKIEYGNTFLSGLDTAVPPGFISNTAGYSAVQASIKAGLKDVVVPLRPTALTWKGWMVYKRIINYDLKLLKKTQRQTRIVAATINDADEMTYLVKAGIFGIQTNYPEMLGKIVKKFQ